MSDANPLLSVTVPRTRFPFIKSKAPVGTLPPCAATFAVSVIGLPEMELVALADRVVTVAVCEIVSVIICVDTLVR